MELITKRAFCKRCGISMPTCYKWIEKDKDGLAAFVHEDGIDAAVFERAPWNTYKSAVVKKDEETAQRIADLETQLEQERAAAAREQEQNRQTIQQQAEIIALLREQLASKDTQINQLHVMMNRQLQALPQPRRTFLEWIGIRKPQQPTE
jgi:flagellar biosynthesis GTPase FlhF